MDDPLARTLPSPDASNTSPDAPSKLKPATAYWPNPKPFLRSGSTGGKPGTRTFKKKR